MTPDSSGSYYLAILTVQITVLTLIAAGIIALYQIHDKQSPKRDFRAVISKQYLVAYFSLALVLVISTSLLALRYLSRTTSLRIIIMGVHRQLQMSFWQRL